MLYDKNKLQKELNQAKDRFQTELKKIRTGKADAEVIGNVKVEAYDTTNPLNAVGQVQVEDAMNVKITVWDRNVIQNVETALREANLGGTVVVEKEGVRIKFAPITEDDRKEIVKDLGQMTEDFRIRVRQIRQDYMNELKDLEGVSEDDVERSEEEVQKMIDEAIQSIENMSESKEKEILTI